MRAVTQQQLEEPSSSRLAQIRPTDSDDVPICVSLAEGTQVFSPSEIHGLEEDLQACLRGEFRDDKLLSAEVGGRVSGFVHYGPSDIGEGTWYLYWIAVDRASHGLGLGLNLLRRVETAFPLIDPDLSKRVFDEALANYLVDNVSAWELQADGNYERRQPAGEPPHSAQAALLAKICA